jgi:hypothetical protein
VYLFLESVERRIRIRHFDIYQQEKAKLGQNIAI